MLPPTPTQHYLLWIRFRRKISYVTSFTISKWLKKYYFFLDDAALANQESLKEAISKLPAELPAGIHPDNTEAQTRADSDLGIEVIGLRSGADVSMESIVSIQVLFPLLLPV